MTRESIELLLERVAAWPEQAQEEFVRSVAEIEARHLGSAHLSAGERSAVQRGLQEMREGRIASDRDVVAMFNRYRS